MLQQTNSERSAVNTCGICGGVASTRRTVLYSIESTPAKATCLDCLFSVILAGKEAAR